MERSELRIHAAGIEEMAGIKARLDARRKGGERRALRLEHRDPPPQFVRTPNERRVALAPKRATDRPRAAILGPADREPHEPAAPIEEISDLRPARNTRHKAD